MGEKRSRPPMKRTTSMVAFLPTNHHHPSAGDRKPTPWAEEGERTTMAQKPRRHGGSSGRKGSHGYVSGPVSPDILPVTTASFLGACGLCRRPLGPGKDTFIYRGEIAFCSLECRQQQMSMDERTEKCSIASMKDNHSQATARSKNSCETAAA